MRNGLSKNQEAQRSALTFPRYRHVFQQRVLFRLNIFTGDDFGNDEYLLSAAVEIKHVKLIGPHIFAR